MKKFTCLRCGKEWMSRVPKPCQCPGCKSYRYNIPKKEKKNGKIQA